MLRNLMKQNYFNKAVGESTQIHFLPVSLRIYNRLKQTVLSTSGCKARGCYTEHHQNASFITQGHLWFNPRDTFSAQAEFSICLKPGRYAHSLCQRSSEDILRDTNQRNQAKQFKLLTSHPLWLCDDLV